MRPFRGRPPRGSALRLAVLALLLLPAGARADSTILKFKDEVALTCCPTPGGSGNGIQRISAGFVELGDDYVTLSLKSGDRMGQMSVPATLPALVRVYGGVPLADVAASGQVETFVGDFLWDTASVYLNGTVRYSDAGVPIKMKGTVRTFFPGHGCYGTVDFVARKRESPPD